MANDDPSLRMTRRALLKLTAAAAATPLASVDAFAATPVEAPERVRAPEVERIAVTLRINGVERRLQVDPRTTLLDALRNELRLTGTKKGCDHGQCGACTVLVDGRRVNACLTLAVMQASREITTIEGLADGDTLHPMQAAFLRHDGFQCGYCTPGQICSASAMLEEVRRGVPSHVTGDLAAPVQLTDDEIRERMSGNICRCSAYPNILAAIKDAARS